MKRMEYIVEKFAEFVLLFLVAIPWMIGLAFGIIVVRGLFWWAIG